MSLEKGGRADKASNLYEKHFLCKLLLELIQGHLQSIEVERFGEEGAGRRVRCYSHRWFAQVLPLQGIKRHKLKMDTE